jgi:hypothetical protein
MRTIDEKKRFTDIAHAVTKAPAANAHAPAILSAKGSGDDHEKR